MESVADLCAAGVIAERAGDRSHAHREYERAWSVARTAQEQAVSAHHVARVTDDPAQRLRWDREAAEAGLTADPTSVGSLLPTLHLAVAASCLRVDDVAGARTALTSAVDAASGRDDVSPSVTAAIIDTLARCAPPDPALDAIVAVGAARRFTALCVLVTGYLESRVAGSDDALVRAVASARAAGLIGSDEADRIVGPAPNADSDVALDL